MGSNSQMFSEKTERYQNQGALFYFGAWVLAQVIEENQPLAVSWLVKSDSPFCQIDPIISSNRKVCDTLFKPLDIYSTYIN